MADALDKLLDKVRFPKEVGWRDQVVGAALACIYVAWLLSTVRELGFPRDEGFYFRAAEGYARWFKLLWEDHGEAMKRGVVDASWSYNHEHPSLMKSLFGISWALFHEKWHVFKDASTAFRLPAMAMAGMAVWVTYIFGAQAYSRRAGLVAAASLALMPRVFFHAHLACFDVPITAMWTLCIYVYWRAQVRGGFLWPILCGIVYGLTLDTKHNAWFLPGVFVGHFVVTTVSRLVFGGSAGKIRLPAALLAMATLGPLVLIGSWPWLWHDTGPRLEEWKNFHLHHEYYNIEFLGRNYFNAPSPRSYMPLMIVATVPAITILLAMVGSFERLDYHARRILALFRKETPEGEEWPRYGADVLFAGAFCAAVAPWVLSSTPIFGGTKHWMPAYPFLALFAGRGVDVVAGLMGRALAGVNARLQLAAQAGLVAAALAAPLAITAHSHPYGLATYVPLVGGTPGGADLGLNRQFWGYTTENAEPWFEANAPRGAAVFIHDTAWDSWARMQDEKRVRPDLRAVGSPGESQIALIQHELHMNEVEYQVWVAFGTDAPAYVVTHDGVPIVSIYAR
jgi:4-amino-4-deoxy-L-arabinose transferase-like glycosyltransferase